MRSPSYRYQDRKGYRESIAHEFFKEAQDLARTLAPIFQGSGIVQSEISRELHCSRQYVGRLLQGTYPISPYKLACLAKMLGYRLRLVLERESENDRTDGDIGASLGGDVRRNVEVSVRAAPDE